MWIKYLTVLIGTAMIIGGVLGLAHIKPEIIDNDVLTGSMVILLVIWISGMDNPIIRIGISEKDKSKAKVLTEGVQKRAGVSPPPTTPKQNIKPPAQKPQKYEYDA